MKQCKKCKLYSTSLNEEMCILCTFEKTYPICPECNYYNYKVGYPCTHEEIGMKETLKRKQNHSKFFKNRYPLTTETIQSHHERAIYHYYGNIYDNQNIEIEEEYADALDKYIETNQIPWEVVEEFILKYHETFGGITNP